MAIQLKSKAKAKPKATRSTARKSTARSKASTGTKRTTARATAKAPAKKAASTRRSSKSKLTQAQLNKILKPLNRVAVKRDKTHDEWKELVSDANEQILDALNGGVPVNLIVEHGQISRQHCYKLIDQAKQGKRSNGSTPAKRKPATKKTATKATSAKRGPGRPKGSKNKPATKRKSGLRVKAKA